MLPRQTRRSSGGFTGSSVSGEGAEFAQSGAAVVLRLRVSDPGPASLHVARCRRLELRAVLRPRCQHSCVVLGSLVRDTGCKISVSGPNEQVKLDRT